MWEEEACCKFVQEDCKIHTPHHHTNVLEIQDLGHVANSHRKTVEFPILLMIHMFWKILGLGLSLSSMSKRILNQMFCTLGWV
jgi:hypothetical protein